MPNAYTITGNGSDATFTSRQALYDEMLARGDVVLEGDDAPKFREHATKRAAEANSKVNEKAVAALERLNK